MTGYEGEIVDRSMQVPEGEPAHARWRLLTTAELVSEVQSLLGPKREGRRVLTIDGRSGAGKSTLAEVLSTAIPGSMVVHADDLAWHEPMFGWAHLLHDLLARVRAGGAVLFAPPAWRPRGRAGAIEVPKGARLVIVEGAGATPEADAPLSAAADACIWVQSDVAEAERLGIERDVASGVNGDRAAAMRFWRNWVAEENAYFTTHRPWERADLVVGGTSGFTPFGDRWAVAASRCREP